MMAVDDFESLLRRHIGLSVESVGSQLVARAVRERQAVCGLADASAYLEYVQRDEAERQELVEAVVVPETWFFRDREAFRELAREAADWHRRHPSGTMRILSVPCASGEEPYSIVLALLESGIAGLRFSVDAVDISKRALAKARVALYGSNSFRGGDLSFRERSFSRSGQRFELAEAVRGAVRFIHGNFPSESLLGAAETYHVIFCRNLLIYFDVEARQRAIQLLTRLLTAGGLLFVGPSETGLLTAAPFVSTRVPSTFAFRKAQRREEGFRSAPLESAPPRRAAVARTNSHSPPLVALAQASAARVATAPSSPVQPPSHQAAAGLQRAAQLADHGRLRDALQLCSEHLKLHGPSPRALHLMGLLSDAAGNRRAALEYYRKTLYLDPNHGQALLHLALILQQEGDLAGAERLRLRAGRHGSSEGH